MSFNKIAIIIIVVIGVAGLTFISPLLGTLFELGDYTWFLIFGVVTPLVCGIILYFILLGIAKVFGLARSGRANTRP